MRRDRAEFAEVEARERSRARTPRRALPRSSSTRVARRAHRAHRRRRHRDRLDGPRRVPGRARPRCGSDHRGGADRAAGTIASVCGRRRRGHRAREPGAVPRDRPVLRRLHADLRRGGRRVSSNGHAPASPAALTAATASGSHGCDEEVPVSAGAVGLPGHLTFRAAQRRSSCSRTAAAAAGTAPATASSPTCSTAPGSARSCSTCSPPPRSATAATCSTSSCSRAASSPPRAGSASRPETRGARIGYFGASTGAAAALWAATDPA